MQKIMLVLVSAVAILISFLCGASSAQAAESLDPDQTYQQDRAQYLQRIQTWQPAANSSRGAKVIRLLRPYLLKYAELPVKLDQQKIVGDKATLIYKAVDPAIDMSVTVDLEKAKGKWAVTGRSLRGKDSMGLEPLPISGLLSIFPFELSLLSLFGTVFFLSLGVLALASLWLIVVAFRVSLPWGLVVFFVPFGNLIFICLNFNKAKSTFLVGLASCIAGGASFMVLPLVVSSVQDVQETFADLNR